MAQKPTRREENGSEKGELKRDSKGRFAKGNAGGGRPPLAPDLKNMLLPLGDKAVKALIAVLDDPDAKHADKLRAAEIVMDRLLGKAALPIVADVHREEQPVTLSEMMARARELIGDDG